MKVTKRKIRKWLKGKKFEFKLEISESAPPMSDVEYCRLRDKVIGKWWRDSPLGKLEASQKAKRMKEKKG